MRSVALEAPFVGRDRELRLVKELFHSAAEEGKAQLVTITGIAGIGKSRLSWEFEKYIDGLADDHFWHRGRCLSYGDGVAYYALAEMVRMRCDIAEDEDPEGGSRETALDARRASPRPGRARLGRASARAPARARGRSPRRPGKPLLRLANPLRATRRGLANDPRVRRHAVGRQRPARLLGVLARVVPLAPALRARAGPTGAGRQAPRLGRRQAQLRVDLPRASVSPGDGRAADGTRARPPGRRAHGNPRPR